MIFTWIRKLNAAKRFFLNIYFDLSKHEIKLLASQVSDSFTSIYMYPSSDVARVYVICFETSGHSIKLHNWTVWKKENSTINFYLETSSY